MARLNWGAFGERHFETGVDRGVLYLPARDGVAWSGITAIQETPTGGGAQPYYVDGFKYLNLSIAPEFSATIEAFAAPVEFNECDGTAEIHPGFYATEQTRSSFSFSYRTLVGNDLEGPDFGYKLHLVYNALADPTTRNYQTLSADSEPDVLSWKVSTISERIPGVRPTAHFVLDSRRISPVTLAIIEGYLYGAEGISPRLPSPARIIEWLREMEPEGEQVPWVDVKRPLEFRGISESEVTEIENLVFNPRGRDTSGTTIVRENVAVNGSFEYSTNGWSVTGATFHTGVSFDGLMWDERYGGPGREGGGSSGRRLLQLNAIAGRDHFYVMTSAAARPLVTPGQHVSVRALVASDPTSVSPQLSIQFLNQEGTNIGDSRGPIIEDAGWYTGKVATHTAIVPEGSHSLRLIVWGRVRGKEIFEGITSERLWLDDVTIEINNPNPPERYYDGDTWLGDTDLTPEWSGEPGNSTSRLVAPRPVNWGRTEENGAYYSASRDAIAITKPDYMLGIISRYSENLTVLMLGETNDGKPAELSCYRNASVPNNTQYVLTASGETKRSHHVSGGNSSHVWRARLDEGQIVYFRAAAIPGDYTGPYFDGHTETFQYNEQEPYVDWTGEPDNSTSVARLLTTTPPGSRHGDMEIINGDLYINQGGIWRNFGPIPQLLTN